MFRFLNYHRGTWHKLMWDGSGQSWRRNNSESSMLTWGGASPQTRGWEEEACGYQAQLEVPNLEAFKQIHREGNGTPLQYSCLENPLDGGAWKAAVRWVAEGQIRLNDFTFTFHFHALEKEMATRSSGLAWRIPGTGEPGGLPSMGSHRVRHDWRNLAAAATQLN